MYCVEKRPFYAESNKHRTKKTESCFAPKP
jgi:hypothetical protein